MFIAIESVDGGGCQTQSELLTENLHKKKYKTKYMKFPHYDTPVGKILKKYLYNNKKLTAQEQFISYSLQFVADAPEIKKASEKGIIIADRYFTTTLCFQTLEGIPEKVALRFAKEFGIIKPDIVFFLDVRPETAIKWKFGEAKKLNFREKDIQFMVKTYRKYRALARRNVWTTWIRINGERNKEEINQEIESIVSKMYGRK